MCVLCDREANALLSTGFGGPISKGGAFGNGDVLPTNVLVSDDSANFSRYLVATDQVMSIYLHTPGGAVQVSGGGFGAQTIQSTSISLDDQTYLGDGYCDSTGGYNTDICNWDEGDCCLSTCEDTEDHVCSESGFTCTCFTI